MDIHNKISHEIYEKCHGFLKKKTKPTVWNRVQFILLMQISFGLEPVSMVIYDHMINQVSIKTHEIINN